MSLFSVENGNKSLQNRVRLSVLIPRSDRGITLVWPRLWVGWTKVMGRSDQTITTFVKNLYTSEWNVECFFENQNSGNPKNERFAAAVKDTTKTNFCLGLNRVSGNLNSRNPDKHRRSRRFVCARARVHNQKLPPSRREYRFYPSVIMTLLW